VDPVIARAPSTGPALFEDGFGERRLALGVNGDHFEVLTQLSSKRRCAIGRTGSEIFNPNTSDACEA